MNAENHYKPRPRAATSVATIIGALPERNSLSTQSLSCWLLSPCMTMAGQPARLIPLVNSSALLFVSVKMMVLFSFSPRICSSNLINLKYDCAISNGCLSQLLLCQPCYLLAMVYCITYAEYSISVMRAENQWRRINKGVQPSTLLPNGFHALANTHLVSFS